MADTRAIADQVEALKAQLQAQRKGYLLPDRYRPRPNFSHLDDDAGFWSRVAARSGIVEGYEDAGEVAKPVKAKAPDSDAPKSDYMTVAEAAAYLNITVDQVRGLASDGSLPSINVGRGKKRPRYRFLKSELDRFTADRTTQEAAQCPSTPRRNTKASTNSISKSNVYGFTARRDALLAARQKNSKR